MLAKVKCVAFHGLDVVEITVEVSVSRRGLPTFTIVGLPNKSVEESKHRIKSAFINAGFEFPEAKIIVNLAPADIQKIGSGYDLPVAVGIFCAVNNIDAYDKDFFFGELSLDGFVHSARGSYLVIDYIQRLIGGERLFISTDSLAASSIPSTQQFFAVEKLSTLFNYFLGKISLDFFKLSTPDVALRGVFAQETDTVIGQSFAKRALEICAAGGHNLMLSGSPGTGKSMLAKSIVPILPSLTEFELSELRKIYSYIGQPLASCNVRPFRSPHHTISYSGMVGGGSHLLPGEVTLSHNGVLFMDEFCEFSRNVLESLRQPMQDGHINLTRNNMTFVFPSRFTLTGATNPCPCGYLGHSVRQCTCTEQKVLSYSKKLSGPLMDRFDLFVKMFPEDNFFEGASAAPRASLTEVKNRVESAKSLQTLRLKGVGALSNSSMSNDAITRFCKISVSGNRLLRDAYSRFSLSPRAYFKVIKVSKTIADLEETDTINESHIAEALQYRQR